MDVPDLAVLEEGRRDEQAVVDRFLDERYDGREPSRRRRQRREARVVEAHRDLGREILEQVAGQPELREDDEIRAGRPGLIEQLMVPPEVLVEGPQLRGDLGQGDAARLHRVSLPVAAVDLRLGPGGRGRRPGGRGPRTRARGRGPARDDQLLGRAVDLLREVAGNRVPGGQWPEERVLDRAALRVAKAFPEPAARMEAAARRRVHRARDVAGQDDPAAARSTSGSGSARPTGARTEYGCRGRT